MRLYFISQNVVIFFYFASFVLMLDVLFLSLGHYLIFIAVVGTEEFYRYGVASETARHPYARHICRKI